MTQTALANSDQPRGMTLAHVVELTGYTLPEIALIRTTVAKDAATLQDLALFLLAGKRLGLEPLNRQIHWIVRGGKGGIQVGIDGFRLVAARTKEYAGSEEPVFRGVLSVPDGNEKIDVPEKASVVVWRIVQGRKCAFTGEARWKEFYPGSGPQGFMWRKMPFGQLAKCFASDTEVLTDQGFQRFDNVTGRVLQVTDSGLQSVDVRPFRQWYAGPMVVADGDMLNFSVTPNHDMITTVGKVEASAMYATADTAGRRWRVPMTAPGQPCEWGVSDDTLALVGYIVADGTAKGEFFAVSVSRTEKVAALGSLEPASTRIVHSRGAVADAGVRQIRSNFDKTSFSFPAERVAAFLSGDKALNVHALLNLSQRQARVLVDSWMAFDGHANRKTGVRRLYTSRLDHLACAEVLAVMAGYSVSVRRSRTSDISDRPNYYLTISEPSAQPAIRPVGNQPGMHIEDNADGQVWCVTVPSGSIVVRRNGFSMVCGNCAEAQALRKGFPAEMTGMPSAPEADDDAGHIAVTEVEDRPVRRYTVDEAAADYRRIHGSDDDGSAFADQPRTAPLDVPEDESDEMITSKKHPLWAAWSAAVAQAEAEGIPPAPYTLPIRASVLQASVDTLRELAETKRAEAAPA